MQLKSSLNWELNLSMAGNKGELQVLIQKSFFFLDSSWCLVGCVLDTIGFFSTCFTSQSAMINDWVQMQSKIS